METPNPIPANRIKFWMYTPPGYDGTPAPLLINLHGQFQIGNNLTTLITDPNDATPAYLIANSQWPASRPFIVVSPQLKPDGTPIADQDWPANYIDEVVEYVKTQRNIDAAKIYIMGLSLGGQGCMIYSAAYPNKVAAMVPISGRTDDIIQEGKACSLVNIPMWIFHGTEDITLNYANATNMAAAVNACPNPGSIKPHVTLLDAGEHRGVSVWNPIYNTSAGYPIYEWLLKFTKNSTANVLPYVNVGTDKKFLVSDGTIYLFGDYFDDDGSITSVAWTQTQGTTLTLDQANSRILKITNPPAGNFTFRLTVTDNLGGISYDDVTVELFGSVPMGMKRITSLRLTNATTGNTDIGPLVNEQVINKGVVGTNDLNVRAIMSTEGGSVVFKVNSNQFTRGLNGWGINNLNNLYAYPNDPWYFPNGWKILTGDHVLSATPYADDGTEGITRCVKFSVINPILQHYYPKPGFDLSVLTSWGTNPPDGSGGASPASFNSNTSSNFQVFNVNKVATQIGTLTIGGNESALWVRNGGEMTVSNRFTGMINVEGNGIVNVNTPLPVAFGSLSPTSTIRFGANATSIAAHTYGNVEILGSGTKTLGSGATTITGNLIIANNVILNGAANNTSVIQLTGNLTVQEDTEFNPAVKFSLTLSAGVPHAINLLGTKAAFNQLTVSGTSAVTVNQGAFPATLELGSSSGGGLIIQNTGELLLNKNHLSIVGQGSINSQNQPGQLGFKNSKLSLNSGTSAPSYVYPKNDMDTVSSITVGLTSGTFQLQGTLYVADSVKSLNGTIYTNGFLALISTEAKTASIAQVEGTGDIIGAVQFQRVIQKGRNYRYLSFPVSGITVNNLQDSIPVTGNFDGASTGPGLSANPSLFYYQGINWIPFPSTINSEEFIRGRGYSVFVREEVTTTKLALTGDVHVGDFDFTTIQPGSSDPNVGWNLIGNPYAAPVQWGNTWSVDGINPTVYVRDNDFEDGRFLQWDGEVGDLEFGGLIAQGQAFWVKAFTSSASLTVHENNKTSAQASFFRTQDESTNKPLHLSISLQQAGLTDRAYLKFNNRTGTQFDPHYDGLKQKNGYFNLSILSSDSVSIAIKNLPDSCSTRVGLSIEDVKPATYTLSFSGSFFESEVKDLFLQDTFLDSLVQINQQTIYAFTVSNNPLSFGEKRFQLHSETRLPEPVISVQGNQFLSNIKEGNQWLLNGEEIPGATEAFYVPVESGDYQVRVMKSSCSKTSAPFTYVITGTEPRHNSIELYPNPAHHSVSVKGISALTPYTLLNAWGQVLKTGLLSSGNTEIELMFSSGFYLLTLEMDSGVQRHKLIIKE